MKHSMQESFPYILALFFALFGGSVVKGSQTGQESDPAPLKKELTELMKAYNENTDKDKDADIVHQINKLYTDAKNEGVAKIFDEVVKESPQPALTNAQIFYVLSKQEEISSGTGLLKYLEEQKQELEKVNKASEDLQKPANERSGLGRFYTDEQVENSLKENKRHKQKIDEEIKVMQATIPLLQRLEAGERIRVIDPSANQPTSPPATTTSNVPLKIIGGAMLLAATAYGLLKLYRWYKQAPLEQEETPETAQSTPTN